MARIVPVLKVPSQFHDGGPEKAEGANHYIRIWNWAVKLPGGGVRPRAEAIARLTEVAIHHPNKRYRRHALTLLKTRFGIMLSHIRGELPWGEKPEEYAKQPAVKDFDLKTGWTDEARAAALAARRAGGKAKISAIGERLGMKPSKVTPGTHFSEVKFDDGTKRQVSISHFVDENTEHFRVAILDSFPTSLGGNNISNAVKFDSSEDAEKFAKFAMENADLSKYNEAREKGWVTLADGRRVNIGQPTGIPVGGRTLHFGRHGSTEYGPNFRFRAAFDPKESAIFFWHPDGHMYVGHEETTSHSEMLSLAGHKPEYEDEGIHGNWVSSANALVCDFRNDNAKDAMPGFIEALEKAGAPKDLTIEWPGDSQTLGELTRVGKKGWVTLSDGRRVFIGGAPREVGIVRVPRQPPIGFTGRTEEDQKRIDDRQRNLSAIAERLGFPGDKIHYVDHPGQEFSLTSSNDQQEAAHFEPDTGQIRVFQNAYSGDNVILEKSTSGTVAHEVMHAKFDAVVKAMNAEMVAAVKESGPLEDAYRAGKFDKPAGEAELGEGSIVHVVAGGTTESVAMVRPPFDEVVPVRASGEITSAGKDKYPITYGWQKVTGEFAPTLGREAIRTGRYPDYLAKFGDEDGITDYSRNWWEATMARTADDDRAMAASPMQAINETLAEWARIELTHQGGIKDWTKNWTDQKPKMQQTYNYINHAYEKIQKAKESKTPKEGAQSPA